MLNFRPLLSRSSIYSLALICFLGLGFSVHADEAAKQEPPKHHFILHQFYNDMTYLLNQPDFYMVVGGLGLAPSAFGSAFKHEDPEFTELWGKSQFADNTFELGETIGSGIFPVSLSAASWGFGKAFGSNRMTDFGTDLIRAQAANGIITASLKYSIHRTRPNGGAYSYPSGHTSSTFAMAGVVYKHFGKTWGIPAFAVATYVGFSRLQENKHYLSDVIAGGIIGTYVSLKLSKHDTGGSSISIAPYRVDDATGLSMSLRF